MADMDRVSSAGGQCELTTMTVYDLECTRSTRGAGTFIGSWSLRLPGGTMSLPPPTQSIQSQGMQNQLEFGGELNA